MLHQQSHQQQQQQQQISSAAAQMMAAASQLSGTFAANFPAAFPSPSAVAAAFFGGKPLQFGGTQLPAARGRRGCLMFALVFGYQIFGTFANIFGTFANIFWHLLIIYYIISITKLFFQKKR